jgi:L-2-hydroxyglutarate oxidase LhgO
MKADYVVIGAGVVGCAIARQLLLQNAGKSVLVIERHDAPGRETSRFNSGVVHSGIHLPPGYLKAKLASQGSKMAIDFCQKMGVAHKKVGMYIVVAPEDILGLWSEVVHLRKMLARAKALGVRVEFTSAAKLKRREPHVRCVFAIRIPEVHIIDPEGFVQTLEREASGLGAEFRYGETCREIRRENGVTTVSTDKAEYEAGWVINAAGLFADEVAALAGYGDKYPKQAYYRGEYYEIDPASGIGVSALVYPVHRPGRPGLGTHLTPKIDGRTFIGPNAVAVKHNQDYDDGRTPPGPFFADVRPFLPGLDIKHLKQAYAGIRPKLGAEAGEKDFLVKIEDEPLPMVNLIGIESPGFTAAMALAQYVADRLPRG